MSLLFEVHITTQDLQSNEIEGFERFCQDIAAKPILIELSKGDCCRQPMISKVFRCIGEELHSEIDQLTAQFKSANYPVHRVKIEVPLELEEATKDIFSAQEKTYFEWHGKLSAKNWTPIQEICLKQDAHLSRNALKNSPHTKFITIRDYESAESILSRVASLKQTLEEGKWIFEKEEFEYCIFDSNVSLDKGWMS